jgi:hypothetical protein
MYAVSNGIPKSTYEHLTSLHSLAHPRHKSLECAAEAAVTEEMRRAVQSDTSKPLKRNCLSDDWHGRAQSSLAMIL